MRVLLVGGDIEGGLLGGDIDCCLFLVDGAGRHQVGFGAGAGCRLFDDV